MDKNAIKKYAVWARNELIERVRQRAVKFDITVNSNIDADSFNGYVFTDMEKSQRESAIKRMIEKGEDAVIEEVAYTWFNRFVALRYMEVNNYLPSRLRIFTNELGEFKPQILTEAIHLDLEDIDRDKIFTLKESNANEELYKYLLLTQCKSLSKALPVIFLPIDGSCKFEENDYTILLFPDNQLREGSIIEQMISMIPEDSWVDAVQIIGWLYQYYNTEPKDQVFLDLKTNAKITKEKIPAATQLFTPDWIVRYMVENSLGRLWLEGHPDSEVLLKWEYYLSDAKQDAKVEAQLAAVRAKASELKPEDILCIDPCMGSGHILAYLFEILMQIYTDYGYSVRDSVQNIIQKNLYGLDIDDRAAQLAYFEIMMTAVKYDSRLLQRDKVPQPHVYAIQESNHIKYNYELGEFLLSKEHRETLKYLLEVFQDAKEYGSVLKIENRDYEGFLTAWELTAESTLNDVFMIGWYINAKDRIKALALQAILLSRKYHVVITNPPYMGRRNMSGKLQNYLADVYPDSKLDLFAVFIERCNEFTKQYFYSAMITQQSWMFLTSFKTLRKKILLNDIVNMVQLGSRAFSEIGGEVVQTTSFIIRKTNYPEYRGKYCRLITPNSEDGKKDMYLRGENQFITKKLNFNKIPDFPIAYWVSRSSYHSFECGERLGSIADSKVGIQTGDNNRFLRMWYEVNINRIAFNMSNTEDALASQKKWFPYNKGGEFRKWYGNNDYIVNWENDGFEIKHFTDAKGKLRSRPQNLEYSFKPSATWSLISSGAPSFRFKPKGHLFDVAGMSFFAGKNLYYLLGLCNSKVVEPILEIIAPTINYQCGDIANIPVIFDEDNKSNVETLVKNNIKITKSDWDAFEISWEFNRSPLVTNAHERNNGETISRISDCYNTWMETTKKNRDVLKANEEKLNEIFLEMYNLQDEIEATVKEELISIYRPDATKDIKALISYAVGCILGRYSLDIEGIVYAGGTWDTSRYQTFKADKDNIIPICDDDYFDDDLTGLFMKFVETVYGKDTLEENLQFIADALDGNGASREIIRNYFLKDFFADHCKMYQKRPIYWLFDSGKNNGFKALVYMHRYEPDLLARMRTDYVHEQQSRYRTAIEDIGNRLNNATGSERVQLSKKLDNLTKQSDEIHAYEEKIHHLADKYITIDLDDGVRVNYAKFQDVLAKIK